MYGTVFAVINVCASPAGFSTSVGFAFQFSSSLILTDIQASGWNGPPLSVNNQLRLHCIISIRVKVHLHRQ
jgi:hypothetical protein